MLFSIMNILYVSTDNTQGVLWSTLWAALVLPAALLTCGFDLHFLLMGTEHLCNTYWPSLLSLRKYLSCTLPIFKLD